MFGEYFEFPLQSILRKLMSDSERKSTINKFRCKYHACTKSFTTRGELKKHVKIHLNVRNYLCEVCSRTFVHKTSLRHHMNTHRETKDSCCSVCGFQCSASNLPSHLLSHQSEKEKKFICKICDKSFPRKITLTDHEASHFKSKTHTCTTCLKSFASSSSLSKHKRQHGGTRRFACTEAGCGMKFFQKVHLDKHSKRVHNKKTNVSGNKITVISDEIISQ